LVVKSGPDDAERHIYTHPAVALYPPHRSSKMKLSPLLYIKTITKITYVKIIKKGEKDCPRKD